MINLILRFWGYPWRSSTSCCILTEAGESRSFSNDLVHFRWLLRESKQGDSIFFFPFSSFLLFSICVRCASALIHSSNTYILSLFSVLNSYSRRLPAALGWISSVFEWGAQRFLFHLLQYPYNRAAVLEYIPVFRGLNIPSWPSSSNETLLVVKS